MPRWTVDAPTRLDFDNVTELHVRLIGGTVAVLASDDRPSLVVTELSGRPLRVSHEDGTLTVSHESLTWEGLLGLRMVRREAAEITISVPADCAIQLGVLDASAVVSGLRSGASVKGLSGDITLDGITGDVDAETISGELVARDLAGSVRFKSVSGALALASGCLDDLAASTVSGQVTADFALGERGQVRVSTMSGDVTLRLPADSDAEVRLHSTSGAVRTEFGSLRKFQAPASRTVSGNVGAGTGRVSVSTMSGSVTLLRRAPVEMESKTL